MGAATVTVLVTLEDMGPCYVCGTRFAAESQLKRYRLADKKSFWCPNGHIQQFTAETEAERLARELEQQKQKTARAEELARQRELANCRLYKTTRQLSGKLRALKQRVGNGVCPCCHRSFAALARHMRTKHPAWLEEQEKAAQEMRLLGSGEPS